MEYNILPPDLREQWTFDQFMNHRSRRNGERYDQYAPVRKNYQQAPGKITLAHFDGSRVCKNLYDEFDRHADLNQEDIRTAFGDDLSTSSLQNVSPEVMGVTFGIGTQDSSTTNEDCMVNMSPSTSDFYDSSYDTLHLHGLVVSTHMQDSILEFSHDSTKKLGTNDALYDGDSCHGESDFLNQTLQNKFED